MALVEAPDNVFLDDFGIDLVGPGSAPFRALFDQPDELVTMPEITGVSRDYLIRYASADITLNRGDAVLQGAVAYVVREKPRQVGDGRFTEAMLTKV